MNNQTLLSRLLIQYRVNAGYSSAFEAAEDMGAGRDTVYRYETNKSVPTRSMLESLKNLYRLQEVDRIKLEKARDIAISDREKEREGKI